MGIGVGKPICWVLYLREHLGLRTRPVWDRAITRFFSPKRDVTISLAADGREKPRARAMDVGVSAARDRNNAIVLMGY